MNADAHQAFYGDLHLHTGYSFDAYLTGTSIGPNEAYRFARGESVTIEGATYQRATPPLDFLAVTDHAEWMNVPQAWQSPESPPFLIELYRKFSAALKEDFRTYLKLDWPSNPELPPGADMQAVTRAAWQRQIEAANRHYRPGEFTTLLGYEWTSQTMTGDEISSLHRNVIFGGSHPPAPFTSIDSGRPEALWASLDRWRKEGHEALAIAGHPHLSRGGMFDGADSEGRPIDAPYAAARAANEVLLEITQNSGDSEAHVKLSPDDEFADVDFNDPQMALVKSRQPPRGSYARYALSEGMRVARRTRGVNPYRFGFVGSSDFHNGRSESAESAEGHRGSGSLTGVWAEQNTRESIFAALRRRETFATSGTRLKLRFFGGWNYEHSILNERHWVRAAYRDGVPMGSDLPARSGRASAPVFLVQAEKDADGANLDRLQIVKVWLEGEQHAERVYDVALSDGRRVDPKTGRGPAVGNTVDPTKATYTNAIGAPRLAAVWRDPDFDPGKPAAYYLRALEIPTPHMSTFSARRKGAPPPSDRPATLQERGWASPIWYTPHAVAGVRSHGAREWAFDRNSDREGWSVPERLTGAVMGGSLWLTPTPNERDPTHLASLNYQIYGDYDVLKRLLSGEPTKKDGPSKSGELSLAGPASVDIVSPDDFLIATPDAPDLQLQARIRVLNLSAATNLDLKWRSTTTPKGEWDIKRCALRPDLKQWQDITCFFDRQWRGTVSQIALGLSENLIRGDLWIDSIEVQAGPGQPIPVRPDIASAAVIPRISVPGLSQLLFADAFKVLDENLVIDVPAYGFPYPFIRPSGDGKYGDYWFYADGTLAARAASWTNHGFAENVMRGIHELQAINPDGRFPGVPWEAITGQVGDITNGGPLFFFEAAFAIASRSHDEALRTEVFQTMSGFLNWYLSPTKRDATTGLITGTHEEVLFAVGEDMAGFGFDYVQTRAPVALNVATAVSASLAAELAAQLGKTQEAARYRQVFAELKESINLFLWNEKEGVYYDYDLKAKQPIRYLTAATFFPLRLAIAPPKRCERLLDLLTDSTAFNWGQSPVPNISMTLAPKFNFMWALTNVPIVRGLEESRQFKRAAELNWKVLEFFQRENFPEFYSLSGEGIGGERYGFTAAEYAMGVIERLFGVDYDAPSGSVRIAPLIPPNLYGREVSIEDLILPTGTGTRLAIRVTQRSAKAAQISVAISGQLPKGEIRIRLPGNGKTVTVPAQASYTATFK